MKRLLLAVFILGFATLASAQPERKVVVPLDSALDNSCSACHDFFQYASGNWIKHNPIPPEFSQWGIGNLVILRNENMLRAILEKAAKGNAPEGSLEQKIGDLYFTAMDTNAIEQRGLHDLIPQMGWIENVHDQKSLAEVTGYLHRIGANPFFYIFADQDAKNSNEIVAQTWQGGLGLPDRDYYFRTDARSQALREKYVKHVTKMLELIGEPAAPAAKDAEVVMAIETKLADSSSTNVEQRDPQANYNRMTPEQLRAMTPGFDWSTYFDALGFGSIQDLNAAQPRFLRQVSNLVATEPIQNLKTYLRWHLIHSAAPYMPSAIVQENFAFYSKELRGAEKMQPRWRRSVYAVDRSIGEALGEVYTKVAFPAKAKARAREMVTNIVTALREDIKGLDWMSAETKKKALEKVDAIKPKIGYPDVWRDYSTLAIDRSSYAQNMFRANQFELARTLKKIGKPVDRNEWGMTPQTFNAYYNPAMNEIVFPAGMLQSPYFDPEAEDAQNYGSIGSVIGHELTHGFDDNGAQYDAKGNLTEWWTPEDYKHFQDRAECVVKQFDAYTIEDSLHLTGKLVVGESIADLGGVLLAYRAFEHAQASKPAAIRNKKIEGFTPEQRFFLAFAQSWAESARPESERMQISTDPHPPSKFRVNGPLSNLPEFRKAFGCKTGEAMVRSNPSCAIW